MWRYRDGIEQGEQVGPAPKRPNQYIGPLPMVVLVEAETGRPVGWRRIEAAGDELRSRHLMRLCQDPSAFLKQEQ